MYVVELPEPAGVPRQFPRDGSRRVLVVFCLLLLSFSERVYGQAGGDNDRLTRARKQLPEKIESLRWIAFSPSTFDPRTKPTLLRSDVESDLKVLKDAGFDGLVTYSCGPRSEASDEEQIGFRNIPGLARAAGFKGCIVGVWDPGSESEVESAIALAKDGLVDAVCVGNEGLDDRYDWDKLVAVISDVRSRGEVPCTTTEQVEDYSFDGLRDPNIVDLILPNVHPVFQNTEDPAEAAEWTVFMVQELRKLDADRTSRLPLLLKETGWPSQGMNYHSERNQQVFWDEFDKRSRNAKIPYAMFESFDQSWKDETVLGKNVGPHWGVFSTDRRPKLAVKPRLNRKPDD